MCHRPPPGEAGVLRKNVPTRAGVALRVTAGGHPPPHVSPPRARALQGGSGHCSRVSSAPGVPAGSSSTQARSIPLTSHWRPETVPSASSLCLPGGAGPCGAGRAGEAPALQRTTDSEAPGCQPLSRGQRLGFLVGGTGARGLPAAAVSCHDAGPVGRATSVPHPPASNTGRQP